MDAYKAPLFSVQEYIAHEQESGVKYEYCDGQIYAMAGGSINHGLLCGNIYSELRSKLKANNSDCKPVVSEIKLNIESKNSFVYPDAMVICGDMEPAKQDKNAITNPILIVEVLSKTTADYDRGDKFHLYCQIASFQEYVLIEQDKPSIEVFYKKPGSDLWRISRTEGLQGVLKIHSLNIEVALSELYYDINFPLGN